MASYTSAYSQFISRLREINSTRIIARRIERAGPTKSNLETTRGLCRGGIVLLCSHIEGYIEDLVSLALDRLATNNVPKNVVPPAFRFHLSRDLIEDIHIGNQPDTVARKIEELWDRDGHIWDINTPHFSHPLPVDQFIGRFSTPTHRNISRLFRRFGYVGFDGDLSARLTSNAPSCKNMIDQVVYQRNRIAHGDVLESGTPADLAQMCALVKLYCRNTDHVVGNWFRSMSCSIR